MRHVLVNGAGGTEFGEKMTKCDMGGVGFVEKCQMSFCQFLNDPF